MIVALREFVRSPRLAPARATALRLRGLLFVGRRYECPCCEASLRGFVGRWGFVRASTDGYCPRCNAKARHRRIWRFLEHESSVIDSGGQVLEIAPWPALASAFGRRRAIHHVGVDLRRTGPHVNVVGDAVALPFRSGAFDFVLCVHVLEHIVDDHSAIDALFDVVRPGGWALVSVPLHLDRPTHEDPTITDPDERARVFGERSHVRAYGRDLGDRLAAAGFEVELHLARDIPAAVATRYGLRDDENIFRCVKPTGEAGPRPSQWTAASGTGE